MVFLCNTTNAARTETKPKLKKIYTSQILREDVYDVIKDIKVKDKAITEIFVFFQDIEETIQSFKHYGKQKSIKRIISDLDSYKEWDDE